MPRVYLAAPLRLEGQISTHIQGCLLQARKHTLTNNPDYNLDYNQPAKTIQHTVYTGTTLLILAQIAIIPNL